MSSPKCEGHLPCDDCRTCRAGRCCRKDNPDYRLPDLGSIAPFYGSLGERRDAGDRVECHICGEWFLSVGSHSWAIHDVTVAEYRAAFGLGSRGLVSADYRARLSAQGKRVAEARVDWVWPTATPTPEQRRAGRESLEVRRKLARSYAQTIPRLIAAGHSAEARAKMTATHRSKSQAMAVGRSCAVCGNAFRVPPHSKQRCCGAACRHTLRQQNSRRNAIRRIAEGSMVPPPEMTPDRRAKLSVSQAKRWANMSDEERASQKARATSVLLSMDPDLMREQRRRAARRRGEVGRKPHYCTAGCGTLIPKSTPLTCSPACRKVVRQRTALASLARR